MWIIQKSGKADQANQIDKAVSEKGRGIQWLLLLTKIDGLNRRVKEPGWQYEDKKAVYDLKDQVMADLLRIRPGELSIELFLVPYYSYSRESKDRAGELMRRDPERKPFEYYLGQITPSSNDIEIPEKATVELLITCEGQEFSFHQPMSWYIAQGGDPSALTRKTWISAGNFHHAYLEKMQKEIHDLQKILYS